MSLSSAYQRFRRTYAQTFPAADTFRAVRIFPNLYVHLTRLFTFSTSYTQSLPQMIAVQRNRMKQTVGGTKGTDIFTERTADPQG